MNVSFAVSVMMPYEARYRKYRPIDQSIGIAVMFNRRKHTDQDGISACSLNKSLDIERCLAGREMAEQIEIDAGAHCCSTERLVTA